jgi:hypothetical protein
MVHVAVLEGTVVSYSFREPEWPATCECWYDETRDQMDREDCPFHCHLVDNSAKLPIHLTQRKQLGVTRRAEKPVA